MNSAIRKHVANINGQRKNQRYHYVTMGHEADAYLLQDTVDTSMGARECIIIGVLKCEGWSPVEKKFVTICFNKKPDLSYLEELIKTISMSLVSVVIALVHAWI